MTLEEYKNSKKGHTFFKFVKTFFVRTLICGIIVLSILVICNLSPTTKALIKEELFTTNFDFSFVNKIYSKLFNKDDKSSPVSVVNNLNISEYENYGDGVSIKTTKNDSVSLIESGIVVFIGEKESYGNTIIVQQSDGVDVWYGNVDNVGVNLYDYITKGSSIATSNESLYLVFQKDGEFLNYKEYIG